MCLEKTAYYKILNACQWKPSSYKEIADSLMKNGVKQDWVAFMSQPY